MKFSPESVALDAMRVVFAAFLCLTVPFAALYSAVAIRSLGGLVIGLVPLGGAVWLLTSAKWPVSVRVGMSLAAAVGTIVWSTVVISQVFAAWSS